MNLTKDFTKANGVNVNGIGYVKKIKYWFGQLFQRKQWFSSCTKVTLGGLTCELQPVKFVLTYKHARNLPT